MSLLAASLCNCVKAFFDGGGIFEQMEQQQRDGDMQVSGHMTDCWSLFFRWWFCCSKRYFLQTKELKFCSKPSLAFLLVVLSGKGQIGFVVKIPVNLWDSFHGVGWNSLHH